MYSGTMEVKKDAKAVCPLRPLRDWLIVAPERAAKVTAGGILLPDEAQEPADRGTVLAAGPGRFTDRGATEPMGIAAGDVVYYYRNSGATLYLNGVEYLCLQKGHVLSVAVPEAGPQTQTGPKRK